MDTANMNKSVTNINALGFTNIWSGTAYEAQSVQLSDLMTKLNKCIADISAFDAILLLRDLYIALCAQIKSLYAAKAACASGHGEEEKKFGCGTCSSLASQIAEKERERTELRNKIIGLLGQFSGIDAEVAAPGDLSEEVVPDELEGIGEFPEVSGENPEQTGVTNPNYDGIVLSPSKGRSPNGPQAEETWYDLPMGYVVERMETVYGQPIETWVDRDTGLKMCRPVGEEDKAYVMVAADVHNVWGGKDLNPDATYSMGDIVLTSWGEGMVVDYCGEAVQYREQGKSNRFDIATAWWSGYYDKGMEAAEAANSQN
jgi:hypothetical protein